MKVKTIEVGTLDTNCYIVSDGGDAVVIDPGADAERILKYIKRERLAVRYIMLTHGHFDHILAAPELKRATSAAIVISPADADCLMSPLRSLSTQLVEPQECIEPDIIASDGSMFVCGRLIFRYMHTPGHTVGSSCIICGDTIFTGDTLFQGDCGRTDLPGGSYADILDSLRRISSLPGNYIIYPGHGNKTDLTREEEYNLNLMEALTGDNSEDYGGGAEYYRDIFGDDYDEEYDDEDE